MAKELSSTSKKPKATKGNKKRTSAAAAQTATDSHNNINGFNVNGAKAKAARAGSSDDDDDDDDNDDDSAAAPTNASAVFASKNKKMKIEENGAAAAAAAAVTGVRDGAGTVDPEQNMALVQFIPSKDENSVQFAEAFWKHQFDVAETIQEDFKTPELPLARVKRVMKTDPEVAMIASEVPVILEKACQIFIADLTARAYIDSPKRRTLTKVDVARAARQTDMFDFLIDILPFPSS